MIICSGIEFYPLVAKSMCSKVSQVTVQSTLGTRSSRVYVIHSF